MLPIPPLPTLSFPVRRHSQVDLSQNQTAVDSQVALKVRIDFEKSEPVKTCVN